MRSLLEYINSHVEWDYEKGKWICLGRWFKREGQARKHARKEYNLLKKMGIPIHIKPQRVKLP